MVLLNGVKYACERCIRGHRVSSCTHTDKPLTMIKPKGRPALQCSHCREQRKLKNSHSSCNCGKKGKSPGQHFASCLCHKNSHCTCPTKDKKAKPKRAADAAERDADKDKDGASFLIEDVVVPFEADQGLLDYFRAPDPDHTPYARKLPEQQFPNPPSDAELDLMENMFPLFPLVGNCSFDNSTSLPLLPMPAERDATRMAPLASHQLATSLAQGPHQPRPLKPSASFNNYPARPRRPESVLSVGSTSSSTSRANLFDHPSITKLASTTAFPPFQLENNSLDDFGALYDASGAYADQLFTLHDDERVPPAASTPQLSLPSRQSLQTRRKTSLSMAQFLHHHGHAPHVKQSPPDEAIVSPLAEYPNLRQVEEEAKDEEAFVGAEAFVDAGAKNGALEALLAHNLGLSLADLLDAMSFPMYLELAKPEFANVVTGDR